MINLEEAADLIRQGYLVAFPTETVYGLGASIQHPEAIARIFQVKKRPADNPLIVHIHSIEQVEELAEEIPAVFYILAIHFWPGPLSCVLKRKPSVPSIVSAGLDSIAIRIPSHSLALELIRRVGSPLVAPSANLSGKPSSTCAAHVLEDFQGQIAGILDGGKSLLGIESTVVDLRKEGEVVLLRPGSIGIEDLERVLGAPVTLFSGKGSAPSPGMRYRHYSPECPVKLFKTDRELQEYLERAPLKKRMLLSDPAQEKTPHFDSYLLSAEELYALLRQADREEYEEVLVFCNQTTPLALMNRLTRAADSV